MKNTLFRILLVCALVIPHTLSAQTGNQIVYGEKHTIASEILGQEKEYWVHLPMNYNESQERYPVIYITDGAEHFFLASGITQFMSSQYLVPEFIVVAIFHKDRTHDLTPTHCLVDDSGFESDALKESGGGPELLEFIEKELIVQVESNYRTGTYRILAGHSLGGLFSVYAYLNNSQLFNAFISMDPALTWDNHYCERTLKTLPSQSPVFNSKLYISSAHNAPPDQPDTSPFRLSQDSFYRELTARKKIEAKHEYFENENHLTVPYRSLYSAMSYIFAGYYIFDNPDFTEDVTFIVQHYKKASELYGIEFTPPEGLIEMLGKYFLLDKNDYEKAAEFFNLNITNYPTSSTAFGYLAKAYIASGNIEDAITCLKRSLELNSENNESGKLLNELKER